MSKVVELLRDKACYYLDHTCETIDKSLIHVPSPDTIDKIWIDSDWGQTMLRQYVRCPDRQEVWIHNRYLPGDHVPTTFADCSIL